MNNVGFVKVEVLQASNTKVLAINDTRVSLEKGYGIMTPIASFEVGVEDILNAMNYKPKAISREQLAEAAKQVINEFTANSGDRTLATATLLALCFGNLELRLFGTESDSE